MKILIIGTGAIGSFYGCSLSKAKEEIYAICRSDFNEVKENGIEVKSINGDYKFWPKEVFKNIADVEKFTKEKNLEFDVILIATKAIAEIKIHEEIKNVISKNSTILLIQNGIFIEEDLAKTFPNNLLISSLAFVGVSKIGHGKIDHKAYGKITIGNYDQNNKQKNYKFYEIAKKLQKSFQEGKIECEISDNIQKARWKKLIWNVPFNPLSVIYEMNTKEIIENENLRNLAKEVMKEVILLSKYDDCELNEKLISENISATIAMKPYKTSMLLDFEAKRQMEIEAIIGNLVKFAKKKFKNNKNIIPNITEIHQQLLIKSQKNA